MIDSLEFKVRINKLLKRKTFEEIFDKADTEFTSDFSDFIRCKIGQIWLKKENGQRYTEWQSS